MQRLIFHLDMDAFFASVEQRDNPEYRGKPLIVGGAGRRGVVAAASYEAREFGVFSAMPTAKALRLCPHAIIVSNSTGKYSEASAIIMEVMKRYSPVVEPLSLDEAFMDMTGTEKLFGQPLDIAHRLKDEIFEETGGLTSSIGIAPNKFLAKIASDMNKPNGITVIPFGQEAESIAALKIERMWGVGKKASGLLRKIGLDTIGDIAASEKRSLVKAVGPALAEHIYLLSRGEDRRVVISDLSRKSVGSECTFEYDISGRAMLEKRIRPQAEIVARALRAKSLKARGVRVKVRLSKGFILQTRQMKLDRPYDASKTIFDACCQLLKTVDVDAAIRLVGATAFDLVDEDFPEQIDLFSTARKEKQSKLEHTMDAINKKLGQEVKRGSSISTSHNKKKD